MGQLVDVVPNHMGIGDPGNYRWLDVLENGPASIYARFFDINWRPTAGRSRRTSSSWSCRRSATSTARCSKTASCRCCTTSGAFAIAYYDHRFPGRARHATRCCSTGPCDALEDELGHRHEQVQELASILTALRHLPPRRMLDADAIEERNREKEIVKRRIATLTTASAAVPRGARDGA